MGMYDSLFDEHGKEWQTKAFDCVLARYRIGDRVAAEQWTFQLEVLGDTDSLATIRNGVLVSVDDPRDPSLPLMDYGGGLDMGEQVSL